MNSKNLFKLLKSQSGFAHLVTVMVLLVLGIIAGVALIKGGTGFIPFADVAYPVTKPAQGYYLSAFPHVDPTIMTDAARLKKPGSPFNPGDQIAVYVKVASDLASSTNFSTTISYPADLLEATKIITSQNVTKPEPGKVVCKSDKDCTSTEYCAFPKCTTDLKGSEECAKKAAYCESKVGMYCTTDAQCGAEMYCDLTKKTIAGGGGCQLKSGNIAEGQLCMKTSDCQSGLKCATTKFNSKEGATCQRDTGSKMIELKCATNSDCERNWVCETLQGSSYCSGDHCSDDMVFQGTYCGPNYKTTNEQAGSNPLENSGTAVTSSPGKTCSGLSDTSCGEGESCYSNCSTNDARQGAITYSCYKSDAPPVCPSSTVLGVSSESTASATSVKSECKKTGCSGQICSDNDYITTCRWSEEFSCYSNALCERQSDGKCGWTKTESLKQCLKNAQKLNIGEGQVCFSQGSCAPGLVCTPNKCDAPTEVCNRYEITSTCQKPNPQKCPAVITRACKFENVRCLKGHCPKRQICKDFASACEVPPGWFVTPKSTLPVRNEKDFFIQNWTQNEFKDGLIKLEGSTDKEGLKTTGDPDRPTMAIVVFTAKKTGRAELKVTEGLVKSSLSSDTPVEKGSAGFDIVEPSLTTNNGGSDSAAGSAQVQPTELTSTVQGTILNLLFGNK